MSNEKKLISIVIPVYNAEMTIKQCLESIICQVNEDVEILLVNDGSTDNSESICNSYVEKYSFISLINKNNGGVSSARNEGIKNARGKYLITLDSDDELSKDAICILKRYLPCNDLIAYGYRQRQIYTEKKIVENDVWFDNKLEFSIIEKTNFPEFYCRALLSSPCNKVYDLSIIKKQKIYYDESISLGEDLLFNIKYLEHTKCRIVCINKSLCIYNNKINAGLSSARYDNHLQIQKRIFEKLLQYAQSINVSDRGLFDLETKYMEALISSMESKENRKKYKEIEQIFAKLVKKSYVYRKIDAISFFLLRKRWWAFYFIWSRFRNKIGQIHYKLIQMKKGEC